MKLSIITINYNNASGLRKTLASVAAQTYRNIEHIIVDGASSDGSVDIIRDYESTIDPSTIKRSVTIDPSTIQRSVTIDPSTIKRSVTIDQSTIILKWSSEPDHGIYDAMSKGVRRATGDYVWILNSGDCVAAPDTVERMMAVLEQQSCALLLGNIVKLFPDGRHLSEKKGNERSLKPVPLSTSMLTFYQGTVPQDAAFVRRDLFDRYGLFDPNLKICADWKLYLNMIALGDVIPMYVDIDVVLFDMSGISNTNMERRNAEKRAYLESILPASVLRDYDAYAFPIEQYRRLRRYHLWGFVYFIERVLFKLEKWGILNHR